MLGFFIIRDWPDHEFWGTWFCSLVRAMHTLAWSLGRLLINWPLMECNQEDGEELCRELAGWNCDVMLVRKGVPELRNILRWCVQGQVADTIGDIDRLGEWQFW